MKTKLSICRPVTNALPVCARRFQGTLRYPIRLFALVAALAVPSPEHVAGQDVEPAAEEVDPAAPVPGANLAVSLVTFGPGDIFWESFGHNALWVENRTTGQGILYHWGLFDFAEPGFVPRFLKGEMIYSMGAGDPTRTFQAYEGVDRSITVQELNLTPAQRLELFRLADENLQDPRYRYDIFLDNCSTRVRDLIDRVSGGALQESARAAPGHDYWFHVARLTQHRPEVLLGMEIFLGNGGSRPITHWDAAFTPLVLDEIVREATVLVDGTPAPLVAEERVLYEDSRAAEPAFPTPYVWIVAVIGLFAAGVLGLAAWSAGKGGWPGRAAFALIGGGWSFVAGLLGSILVSGFLTDHHWMFWNENLLQFTPLSLALAVLVPKAALSGQRGMWVGRLALLVAGLSVLGWVLQILPGLDQRNGELLSITVPLHLALVWGLTRLPLAPGAMRPGGFPAPEKR